MERGKGVSVVHFKAEVGRDCGNNVIEILGSEEFWIGMNLLFFFFQAEDGIRVAQESRGLGMCIRDRRYLKMNGKRRLLGSFNHGSMANAMPQALGAQATEPERQVVAMCGDGGFSMLMGDFLSVMQMKLPVKIIVFNNSVLGFVAMEMKAGGYLTDGTELHDTNFARIAEACGITGIRVEKASEVDEALQRAFSIDGPVLVDVVVAKEELAIPPQIKLEQAKGFSLYMLRAIISGRGDEVIELAKTNWLR